MPGEKRPDGALPPHPTLSAYYGRDEERAGFVRGLFDASARDYDRIERGMALGWGSRYRREALRRAGLVPGLKVLDVAVGTGLVAREAVRLVGDRRLVTGLDPSAGMLLEARRQLNVPCLLGTGERLPLCDASFDLVSMGYALRHLSDLTVVFREFARVLRPGGTVCILELTRPASGLGRAALRAYLRYVVPTLARVRTRNREAQVLMRYFWDTIETCVPAERILTALDDAGLEEVHRALVIGLFSEYTGRRSGGPGGAVASRARPERSDFFVRQLER